MRTSVQIEHTGKVTRIAHVHGVGNGSNGRTGTVFTGLQILIENIITVVGGNKTLHRQAHLFAKQSGCDISEVSARYTDHCIVRLSGTFQLGVCIEIIKRLRKKTGYIDGISGSQRKMFIQLLIHESRFYQCLTVVECSVYFERSNILSQRSKLLFLNLTDLPFRVKHIHMDTFHS